MTLIDIVVNTNDNGVLWGEDENLSQTSVQNKFLSKAKSEWSSKPLSSSMWLNLSDSLAMAGHKACMDAADDAK